MKKKGARKSKGERKEEEEGEGNWGEGRKTLSSLKDEEENPTFLRLSSSSKGDLQKTKFHIETLKGKKMKKEEGRRRKEGILSLSPRPGRSPLVQALALGHKAE